MIGDDILNELSYARDRMQRSRDASVLSLMPENHARLLGQLHANPLLRQVDEAREQIALLDRTRRELYDRSDFEVAERYRRRAEEIAAQIRGARVTVTVTLELEAVTYVLNDSEEERENKDECELSTDATN
jgi:hypothetical protein